MQIKALNNFQVEKKSEVRTAKCLNFSWKDDTVLRKQLL